MPSREQVEMELARRGVFMKLARDQAGNHFLTLVIDGLKVAENLRNIEVDTLGLQSAEIKAGESVTWRDYVPNEAKRWAEYKIQIRRDMESTRSDPQAFRYRKVGEKVWHRGAPWL